MDERRREARQKSLLGGKVIFDDHNCSMDCTVRNLSPTGALIVSTESYRMPEKFDFAIPVRDEEFHATIVWRKGSTAGLVLTEAEVPLAAGLASRQMKPGRRKTLYAGY